MVTESLSVAVHLSVTDTLAAWLFTQTWQVALAVLAVAFLARRFGRSRPHLAHALWLVVVLKCFLPPVWTSPSGVFCWLMPPQSNMSTSDFVESMNVDEGTPVDTLVISGVLPPADSRAAQSGSTPLASNGRWASFYRLIVGESSASWKRLFVAGWLLGASIVLLCGGAHALRFFRRLRQSTLADSRELQAMVERLREQLQVKRRVRVRVTGSAVGPVVVGLLRPTIYLPAALAERCSLESLEPILAHELVHQRRGDLWLCWIQWLARALWWFHPCVAWACRQWNREIERCCDEETVASLGYPPGRYARSLLEVLERKQELRAAPVFPGVRPLDVTSQRLERIMRLGQGSHRRTPWWCWASVAIAALLVLPGASFVAEAKDRRKERRHSSSAPAEGTVERRTAMDPAPLPPKPNYDDGSTDDAKNSVQLFMEVWSCDSKVFEKLDPNWTLTANAMVWEKDDARLSSLVKLQGDVKIVQIAAPRIVTFFDRPVTLSIVDQKAFLVGFERSEDKAGRTAPPKPIHKVVDEGLKVEMRAERHPSNGIKLHFKSTHTEIGSVEPGVDPTGRGMKIEIPHLNTTNVQTVVSLAESQKFIAVGVPTPRTDGSSKRLIYVVSWSKLVEKNASATSLRMYSVADLVVPIPRGEGNVVQVADLVAQDLPLAAAAPTAVARPQIDFQPLINLIQSTIKPEVWKEGGDGRIQAHRIQAHRENLSLVVQADDATHRSIAELLGQLRRVQSVQIVIESQIVQPSDVVLKQAEPAKWTWREADRIAVGPPVAILDDSAAKKLREQLEANLSLIHI